VFDQSEDRSTTTVLVAEDDRDSHEEHIIRGVD
jgi:hypothetical protein